METHPESPEVWNPKGRQADGQRSGRRAGGRVPDPGGTKPLSITVSLPDILKLVEKGQKHFEQLSATGTPQPGPLPDVRPSEGAQTGEESASADSGQLFGTASRRIGPTNDIRPTQHVQRNGEELHDRPSSTDYFSSMPDGKRQEVTRLGEQTWDFSALPTALGWKMDHSLLLPWPEIASKDLLPEDTSRRIGVVVVPEMKGMRDWQTRSVPMVSAKYGDNWVWSQHFAFDELEWRSRASDPSLKGFLEQHGTVKALAVVSRVELLDDSKGSLSKGNLSAEDTLEEDAWSLAGGIAGGIVGGIPGGIAGGLAGRIAGGLLKSGDKKQQMVPVLLLEGLAEAVDGRSASRAGPQRLDGRPMSAGSAYGQLPEPSSRSARLLLAEIAQQAKEEKRVVVVDPWFATGLKKDLTEYFKYYERLGFEKVEMEDGSHELVYRNLAMPSNHGSFHSDLSERPRPEEHSRPDDRARPERARSEDHARPDDTALRSPSPSQSPSQSHPQFVHKW